MHKRGKYFELIRQQEESGFSVKEFCSNEGIAESTFYYWIKKLRGQSDKNDFIPLIINNQQSRLAQSNRKPRNISGSMGSATGSDHWFEVVYSLLGTCKACGVDPQQWLQDVLTRLPYYNNDYSKDLAELLPHNWKAAKDSR